MIIKSIDVYFRFNSTRIWPALPHDLLNCQFRAFNGHPTLHTTLTENISSDLPLLEANLVTIPLVWLTRDWDTPQRYLGDFRMYWDPFNAKPRTLAGSKPVGSPSVMRIRTQLLSSVATYEHPWCSHTRGSSQYSRSTSSEVVSSEAAPPSSPPFSNPREVSTTNFCLMNPPLWPLLRPLLLWPSAPSLGLHSGPARFKDRPISVYLTRVSTCNWPLPVGNRTWLGHQGLKTN